MAASPTARTTRRASLRRTTGKLQPNTPKARPTQQPATATDRARRAYIREITGNVLAMQRSHTALALMLSWSRLLKGLATVMPDPKAGVR